jgi:hypothetical protein
LYTQTAATVLSVVLAAAWGSGVRSPWVYVALMGMAGTISGLGLPAWQSIVTEMVPRDELAKLYGSADLFVFPSKADTFGLVMLEAMACGTPVAAFPVDGPLEVLSRTGPDGRGSLGGAMEADLQQACSTLVASGVVDGPCRFDADAQITPFDSVVRPRSPSSSVLPAHSRRPYPAALLSHETNSGRKRATCSANFCILRPAARATTRNSSRCSITLRVLQPMEPVEPRMEMPFIQRCRR